MSPFLRTFPTVSVAFSTGVRSGRLYLSIGVGTVTMNTVHGRMSSMFVVTRSRLAARDVLGARLERAVDPLLEILDPLLVDVEADRVVLLPELDREGEPHVAEADDGDLRAAPWC